LAQLNPNPDASGFFVGKWPSHGIVIIIVVPIPAFHEFGAFAASFSEEINENHSDNAIQTTMTSSQDNGMEKITLPSIAWTLNL